MKAKDLILQELKDKFSTALNGENPDAITQALADFAIGIRNDVMQDYNTYQRTQDKSILAARGVRQLTEPEEKFYKAMIAAAETGDIKQSFEGLPKAYPESIIDSVIEDIQSTYPLLGAISMQNTSTMTKMIINKKGVQLAVWGTLNSEITKELEGAIDVIELDTNKLSAYMPVAKDMLAVGPVWVDTYVRAVLVEAAAAGLSKAVVIGSGKNEPIGMIKDVSDDVIVTGGVYPDKTQMIIEDLSPLTFGKIAQKVAQGPNNRKRAVVELLCVVNPVDYFEKIFPATTFLTPAGTYVHNVLPYPTKIVQDENVPDGKMIVGLASRYFMGIGVGGSGGQIDFSDEFRFLEDQRVYLTKLYGNGQALDDNAFVYCDISAIKPQNLEVTVAEVKGTVTTKTEVPSA